MLKTIRAALVGALLTTLPSLALAADAVAARMAGPSLHDWTGLYVGLNGGFAQNDERKLKFNPILFADNGPIFSQATREPGANLSGGAQLGYNWQLARAVVGIEVDVNIMDRGKVGGVYDTPDYYGFLGAPYGPNYTLSGDKRGDWWTTVRGRVGYSFDRLMIYATGGLAIGAVPRSKNFSVTNTLYEFTVSPQDSTRTGWVAGAGLEYAVSPNFTVRAEAMHVDLGEMRYVVLDSNAFGFAVRYVNSFDVARIGVNYRF